MVLFELLPNTTRSPLSWTEVRPSRSANVLATKPYKVLIIAQKTTAATGAVLTPTRIFSPAQARSLYGSGSQMDEMVSRYFDNNRATEIWAIAVADAAGAVAETQAIVVGGSPTGPGLLCVYFAGHRVAVPVASGEAIGTTAANLKAAVAADPTVPYTGGATVGGSVTYTPKNAGTLGLEMDVRHSYGLNESLPPGMTLTITGSTTGAGVVSYSTLGIFGLIPQVQFDVIAPGANDTTNLLYITNELKSRWGPTRQIEGCVVTGFTGDLSTSVARGLTLNSEFSSEVPAKSSPSPAWAWGAALAGVTAREASQDQARPFHTLTLAGILPPKESDRFTPEEREQLLHSGMATYYTAPDGSVSLHRLITNYQLTVGGSPDATFLDLNTVLTLSFMRYDWRTNWITRFPRHKLADDGNSYPPGQPIMTPERGRAEAVAWYGKMIQAGLAENMDQFKANLVVERNATDPNRLDFLLPVNLINQLSVVAAVLEFTV